MQQSGKQIAAKGLEKSKTYMNRNCLKKEKEIKEDQSFGWNVFGEQASYKAYERRCEKLGFDPQRYKQQLENPDAVTKPSE